MTKHEKRRWHLAGGLYLTLLLFSLPLPALAYIDPSVSSYLIQAVAGVAVAVGAFAALYFRRARKMLRDRLGLSRRKRKEREEDVRVFDP